MRYRLFCLLLLAACSCWCQSEDYTLPKDVYTKKLKTASRVNSRDQVIIADSKILDTEYVMGPGDWINISIGTSSPVQVGPDGTVFLTGTAPIEVAGLTLAAAKKAIKRVLASTYDTSKVFITLASTNFFKVPIEGEVGQPGAKTTNSFARVKEVLDDAGGFTRYAIRNKIIVVHGDGDSVKINLADYFKGFHENDNPLLRFGDRIRVEKVNFQKPLCIVRFSGDFFYSQLDSTYNLADIFLQITNYTQASPPRYVRLIRKGALPELIPSDQVLDFVPLPNDTIELKQEIEQVFIGGAVARPGGYDYVANYTAADYVFLAGVSPLSASISNITVYRKNKLLEPGEILRNGIKPGDQIYLDRQKMDIVRDYLSIIASLASVALTAVTLYFASGH